MENNLGKCSTGMQPNLAALLSYVLGFISGVIFIIIEKDNKFVRFHALQAIMTFGFFFILQWILGFIPLIGGILIPVVAIAGLIIWILQMVKAYQGVMFKLPFIGDIAEKQA